MANINAYERKRNGRKFDLFYQITECVCVVCDDPWCVQYSSKFHVVCCALYAIVLFYDCPSYWTERNMCHIMWRNEQRVWTPKMNSKIWKRTKIILFAICNTLNLMDSYVCRTSKWSHINMIIAYVRISKLSHRQKLTEKSVSWFLIQLNWLSIPYSIRAFLIRFCFMVRWHCCQMKSMTELNQATPIHHITVSIIFRFICLLSMQMFTCQFQ